MNKLTITRKETTVTIEQDAPIDPVTIQMVLSSIDEMEDQKTLIGGGGIVTSGTIQMEDKKDVVLTSSEGTSELKFDLASPDMDILNSLFGKPKVMGITDIKVGPILIPTDKLNEKINRKGTMDFEVEVTVKKAKHTAPCGSN